MQRKDVLELKKRFKKEECSISRMAGCYVNAQKEKVITLNEMFPNLPEEEYFKYLDIAKKTLSGSLGNNLLMLSFPKEDLEENPDNQLSKQQFFRGVLASELKQEELLDRFYDLIIDHYDYTGNYLILVFYDNYDVMVKTEDGRKVDESEEVYTYMLCALCPVTLSKPGLGYLEDQNKIGVRLRDWIVAPPENGFLFPAFTERSTDIDSVLYYTKNAKEPHPAFMENGLGCESKRTGLQQKKAFENVIKKAVAGTDIESDELFLNIQETICDMVDREELENPKDPKPIALTAETFREVIADCEISEYIAPKIEAAFTEEFSDGLPTADAVLDTKLLAKNEQKKKEKELVREVASLKAALFQSQTEADGEKAAGEETLASDDFDSASDNPVLSADNPLPDANASSALQEHLCDIFLRLKPERAGQITARMINGQKCLVIPIEEGDDIDINGITFDEQMK